VTAAFFVFSPLTRKVLSKRSGSSERFVAMCHLSHTILHTHGSWIVDESVSIGAQRETDGVFLPVMRSVQLLALHVVAVCCVSKLSVEAKSVHVGKNWRPCHGSPVASRATNLVRNCFNIDPGAGRGLDGDVGAFSLDSR